MGISFIIFIFEVYPMMIKKILSILIALLTGNNLFSQCTVENWSLEKRISLSSNIVEGKVIRQYAFRDRSNQNIYTASVVEVYKSFKGSTSGMNQIEIITFGGIIGLEKHQADPELTLNPDDAGIFLLTSNRTDLPDSVLQNGNPEFQGVASIQSFIAYDLVENRAYDPNGIFNGIQTDLYEKIQDLTGGPYTEIKKFGYNPERHKYRPVGPVITGFGSSSASAGTGDILTINGQGFLNTRGKGRIEFLDANYGDGRRFKTPYPADYSVWNDTQIKVRIPTSAGTGSIRIVANDSGTFTTLSGFKINYSHLNVGFKPTGGNEQYYPTDHINDNTKGGYTFQMNQKFKAKQNMVNAFLRAIETWRCGTYMNWEVGRDTALNATAADNTNLIRLVDFPDNKLAVCYSRWNGCYSGTGSNMEWFVIELDIEADSTINWYYGTGNPASNQYDFQSVLAHELGHGHQLGHVIAGSEMMHYSISNGQKKASLSSNDLSGGNYVRTKGANINVCSGARLIPLNANNCSYTKPIAGFVADKTVSCPQTVITFTDTSKGVVKTYNWWFGDQATPATASGKGPHQVQYGKEGMKSVKLYVVNDFGTDSAVKSDYLNILPSKPAAPSNLVYQDTACLGLATLSVDTFKGIGTVTWGLPPQATEISSTINTKKVSWTAAGGPYTFYVNIVNQCGSGDSISGTVRVLNNPTSVFTASENGRTVTFTNTSSFASSYTWLFGDGDSSNLANPVHTYPVGKAYTATLKSVNRCKTVISSKTVNPYHPASVPLLQTGNVWLYPNPVTDRLFLHPAVKSYRLYNAQGQMLEAGAENEVDFNAFPEGLYVLKLHMYNGIYKQVKVIRSTSR